ncbi:MAG: class I tRNA ligase family protein, partial [Chthoniobacterales bacterium]|nr:class I tRNA ligase family protein [Chthoniobacterales bacterium]
CDWFVEAAKTDIFGDNQAKKNAALGAMDFVLCAVLRLLHPFMPHLSEELWSLLGFGTGSIQFAAPPQKAALEGVDIAGARQLVRDIYATVQAGRNLRAESKLPTAKDVRFILRTEHKQLKEQIPVLTRLLNAGELILQPQYQPPPATPVSVTPLGEIFLAMTAGDRTAEKERLEKEIAKIEADLRKTREKLQNQSFVERAPAIVVEEHSRRLSELSAQLAKLKDAFESLLEK